MADSLFGIQYNISDSPIDKYGFQDVYQKDNLTLYENQYSLPIAFASQSVYNDVKFTEHTLDNQASFLNQLADVNFDYFSPIPYEKTENTDDLTSVTSSSNEDAAIQYQIEVPENSQVYLSFTNLYFSNDKQKKSNLSQYQLLKIRSLLHMISNKIHPFSSPFLMTKAGLPTKMVKK